MNFCKHCGSQIEDNAAFCGVCGQAQNTVEPQAQEAPVYTQPQAQAPVYQVPVQPQQPVYVAPQAPVYAQPQVKAPVPGKGVGIAGMVLGIVSLALFCAWYLAIPCAIIGAALGGVGLSKAKAAGMKNGMAAAGVACSCVALGLALLFVLLVFLGVASSGYYF